MTLAEQSSRGLTVNNGEKDLGFETIDLQSFFGYLKGEEGFDVGYKALKTILRDPHFHEMIAALPEVEYSGMTVMERDIYNQGPKNNYYFNELGMFHNTVSEPYFVSKGSVWELEIPLKMKEYFQAKLEEAKAAYGQELFSQAEREAHRMELLRNLRNHPLQTLIALVTGDKSN